MEARTLLPIVGFVFAVGLAVGFLGGMLVSAL
jgi:hypothetical protein